MLVIFNGAKSCGFVTVYTVDVEILRNELAGFRVGIFRSIVRRPLANVSTLS